MYLASSVEPNIFFLLDDSGSMNWVPILPSSLGGITVDSGRAIPRVNGSLRKYYHPDWSSDDQIIPPVAVYAEAWALKSKDANFLYYDPNVTYLPWAGTDASGNPLFIDADPYNAPEDPNNWGSNTVDLTDTWDYDDGNSCSNCLYIPTYYEWVDTDGDGILHTTNDTGTEIQIKPANAPFPSGS